MNNVILTGRLTADPELKTTPSGKQLAKFRIAVNRRSGEGADFIPCEAWGKTAEFIHKWFSKGKPIAVTGSLRTTDHKENGYTRTYYSVSVSTVEFCGNKNEETANDFVDIKADESDLPF